MENNDLKKVNGYYVNKKNVGNRIFRIRNDRNDTLEEFGKLFGAEKSNVLKWENGSSLPNKSRIEKIAKKGNLTVNELLFGDVEEFLSNNLEIITEKHKNKVKKNNFIIKEFYNYMLNNYEIEHDLSINNIYKIDYAVYDMLQLYTNEFYGENINSIIVNSYMDMEYYLYNIKSEIERNLKLFKSEKTINKLQPHLKKFFSHIDKELKKLKQSELVTLEKAKEINDIYSKDEF